MTGGDPVVTFLGLAFDPLALVWLVVLAIALQVPPIRARAVRVLGILLVPLGLVLARVFGRRG